MSRVQIPLFSFLYSLQKMITFFNIFLLILGFFSFLVISSRNPIHSVLALISVFLFSSVLLFCLEVEFLAFSFLIIYVGAIGIFFLFVIMMINLKFWDNSPDILNYGSIGYFISFLFFIEITLPFIKVFKTSSLINFSNYFWINWFTEIETFSNIQAIGQLLYTFYFLFFLIAGFILFIAVVGALMLTLNFSSNPNKL